MRTETVLRALSLVVVAALSAACAAVAGDASEGEARVDESTSSITGPNTADGTDTCGLDGVFTCTDHADVWEEEVRHAGGCTAVPFDISLRHAARSGVGLYLHGVANTSAVTRTLATTDTPASVCGTNWESRPVSSTRAGIARATFATTSRAASCASSVAGPTAG